MRSGDHLGSGLARQRFQFLVVVDDSFGFRRYALQGLMGQLALLDDHVAAQLLMVVDLGLLATLPRMKALGPNGSNAADVGVLRICACTH